MSPELSTFFLKKYLACHINLNWLLFTTGLGISPPHFAIGLTLLTGYVKIQEVMVNQFLSLLRRKNLKSTNSREEALIRVGREQFRKLTDKGIELPVVLL